MAQVYGIPQYPVYSPLAGIADLYKTYKELERQDALDAYAKEKDAQDFALRKQQADSTSAYQTGVLNNQKEQLGIQRENAKWENPVYASAELHRMVLDPNTPEYLRGAAQEAYANFQYETSPMYKAQREADKRKKLSDMLSFFEARPSSAPTALPTTYQQSGGEVGLPTQAEADLLGQMLRGSQYMGRNQFLGR